MYYLQHFLFQSKLNIEYVTLVNIFFKFNSSENSTLRQCGTKFRSNAGKLRLSRICRLVPFLVLKIFRCTLFSEGSPQRTKLGSIFDRGRDIGDTQAKSGNIELFNLHVRL